ncbi:hypothetical protein [Deinococcus multiflagellatus]|uniref:hypothetical protein n=1 Tax=Deinococcus multiflagellatus TaxID=1656887 RepID=UPI001CC937C6|nr:hypothetical protein [Deinococcus multiflagellatus]MBZ9714279.1 hypothetical protein [Deinococcus multiflagellatus]
MSITRHFSDTRTDTGRVRILIRAGLVLLHAEGAGWQHSSQHHSVQDAALELAMLPEVSAELYASAISDLEQQLARDGHAPDEPYSGAA